MPRSVELLLLALAVLFPLAVAVVVLPPPTPPPTAVARAATQPPKQPAAQPTATPAPAAPPTANPPAAPAGLSPQEAQALNGLAWRPENGPPVFAYPLGARSGRPAAFQYPRFGAERWQGPADSSGQFTAAWDSQFLYLSVSVLDDRYLPWSGEPALLYLGDALELQLDPDLPGSFQGPDWGGGAVHLGLRPAASGNGPGDAYIWTPVNRAAPEVRVATQRGPQPAGYALT